MPQPAPATLYRVAAIAGGGGAVILLVNAAKRAGVVPTSPLTQLVAPLAEVLALALVAGLYLAFGRRRGTFGLVAYLLNSAALAGLVGVEIVINLVFGELPRGTVGSLRAGPLGLALAVVSVAFLLGTLAFVASLLLSREVPVVPLVLYAVGAVPVALRAGAGDRPGPGAGDHGRGDRCPVRLDVLQVGRPAQLGRTAGQDRPGPGHRLTVRSAETPVPTLGAGRPRPSGGGAARPGS